ncbi:MAG: extensin family protein [Hyphomicrobiaceae bacterium]|nr:extensin family protein [Hyphomicrobiaceae bacterium]
MVVAALAACNGPPSFVAKEEPWREEDERACLASGLVRETPFLTPRSALGGPSVCGALKPFAMSAAAGGTVELKPAALLRCPMVPAVDYWVQHVVKPAARRHLGTELVEIKVAGSYSCRPMNHVDGGRLSEHGHANAVDVSTFVLANGERVTVKTGWWGAFAHRNFLRAVHDGACKVFTTVLGPHYDANHRDHFHLDLAKHGRDGQQRVCK